MSRMSRIWKVAALGAVAGALLLPSSSALADGPVATKSGALINYVTTGKLRVGKRIEIFAVCSANCNVDTTTTIQSKGFHQTFPLSGALAAGVPGGPFFKPNGPLLKAMKAHPGRFKIASSMTATDPVTGTVDSISNTFRLKR
jgi:hypothetical protein